MNYFNRMNYVSESYGGMTQDNGVIFEGMADDFAMMVMEDDAKIRESLYLATEVELEGFRAVNAMEYDGCTESAIMETVEDVNMVLEGVLQDFWAKIKAAVKKIKDAIVKFFNAARRFLDAIFMSSQQFITKYADQLGELRNLSGYKYKSYNYVEIDKEASTMKAVIKTQFDKIETKVSTNMIARNVSKLEVEEWKKNAKEDESTFKKAINSKIFDSNTESVSDMNAILFKKFRGGNSKGTQKDKSFNLSEVKGKMEKSDDLKASLKQMQDTLKEEVEGLESKIDDWEKASLDVDRSNNVGDRKGNLTIKTDQSSYNINAATSSEIESVLRLIATTNKAVVTYGNTVGTKVINSALSAHKEQQGVLKWACQGAFKYNRQHAKK
jgi:hypothetical protein